MRGYTYHCDTGYRNRSLHEDDTRLHFDVESDLPRFLDSVLQRTDKADFPDESGRGNCGAAYRRCRSNGVFASFTLR